MKRAQVTLILLLLLPGILVAEDKAATLLTEGRAALEDGLYDIAERKMAAYLKAAGTDSPEPPRAVGAGLLARALYEQRKFAGILDALGDKKGWSKAVVSGAAFSFWRAMAQSGLGKLPEALGELKDFEKRHRGSEYESRALRLRASVLLRAGRRREGLAEFAAFDAGHPDSPEAPANLLQWARALVDTGDDGAAVKIFERLVKFPPDRKAVQEGQYWYGRLLIDGKQPEAAQKILVAVAANEKAAGDLRGEALYAVASVHEAAGRKPEAVQAYSNGIARAQSPALKHFGQLGLGKLLLDMGKSGRGIPLLRAFITTNPKAPEAGDAQLRIGEALLDSREYKRAADEFQYYLETFTNRLGQAAAYRGRGWGLHGTGRYAESATAFQKAYDLYADRAEKAKCLFKVGDAYFANGQHKLAKGTYERVLKENPAPELEPKVLLQLGETVSRMGDPVGAEKLFRQVIDGHGKHPLAEESAFRIARGKVTVAKTYERQGLWAEAMTWFGKAADSFTSVMNTHTNGASYAEALHGRGEVYYQLFKLEQAIVDFTRVIEKFPESKKVDHAHYMRGMCYYRMFQDAKALETWQDFSKRFPGSKLAPKVLFEIGKYHYNQKNYVAAEKQFLAFTDKYKSDPLTDNALLWAGISASRRKEYTRAIELFARMAKEFPSATKLMPKARFEQADSLIELGLYSDAITILDEIINKFPNSDLVLQSWLRKAACQFMLGAENKKRYEEAIKSSRVVVNSANASLEWRLEAEYKIGRCHQLVERENEALEQYHAKVMVEYLEAVETGIRPNEACKKWFTRASLNAADILEQRKEWRKVINILQRIVDAEVPASAKARERIKEIRAKNWWLY
ncbi:tetratricopeptide repeat protein [Verrucomicrobiota bacterium]